MALKSRHWDRLANGGLTFTELGFGSAPLGNLYRAISDAAARAILNAAWECGIRYFDTAPLYGYGLSETRLGQFLRGKPRDDYVLSTKVGRTLKTVPPEARDGVGTWFDVPSRRQVFDYTYDGIMRSLEFSLERLGLDRIDILYVHDLDLGYHKTQAALDAKTKELMQGGYRALIDLRDQGVIRAFGAGLDEWQPCQRLAERGDFDLFLLAGRYTLLEQESLETFLPLCEARGIGVVIGGPYNSGILASGPTPDAHYDYELAPAPVIEKVRAIEGLCRRHNTPLHHAAFQLPLGHPAVVSVIPGGQSAAQVASNVAASRADVPDAVWQDLKTAGLLRSDAPSLGGKT